ncbi:MAG: RNA 3'-terminal phosphate cyclase [Candidatus Thermoplasmatota archaeon]
MIEIDGSRGEGGGQVLRTALTLSCALGAPFSIHSIRVKRPHPGLAHQHLTAVRAAAMISGAEVKGAELGSTRLEFAPAGVSSGDYIFDVGTAGSISLVAQTVLLPLALASGTSRLIIRGGTDVKWSPPIDYLSHVILPALKRMGASATLALVRRGFYPRGGGEVRIEVCGSKILRPLRLSEPGILERFDVLVASAGLPGHVPDRIASACRRLLSPHGEVVVSTEDWSTRAHSTGVSVCCLAVFDACVLGSAGVGEKGLRSEDLAAQVGDHLLGEVKAGATADLCAADQHLLPMALAPAGSEFSARGLSTHAETNIEVIEQFLGRSFEIEEGEGMVRVRRV